MSATILYFGCGSQAGGAPGIRGEKVVSELSGSAQGAAADSLGKVAL